MVSHLKFEAYDKRLTNVNVLFIILADSAIIFLFQFRLEDRRDIDIRGIYMVLSLSCLHCR